MRGLPWLFSVIVAANLMAAGRQEFRAPNGLRVILDPRHERPVLRLHLLVGWDSGKLTGIQAEQVLQLRSILERCGAGDLNKSLLERKLADRGIRLTFEGTGDSLAWTMVVDSQGQEDAFELLGHVVFRPALGDDLGEGETKIYSDPAPEACFRASLGFPTVVSAPGVLGTAARYSLHRRLVRPEHAVLVIQGDLSLAQARQLVLLHLATWSPAPEPPLSGTPSSTLECREPMEGAWAGAPGPGGDAKARAAHIALAILLTRHFREAALADFVFEAFRPGGDAGPFLVGVRSGRDPDQRLRECLESLCVKGFNTADLAFVRQAWQAERTVRALHPEDQIAAIARVALQGDPGANLMDLRVEEINAALRGRLAPKALRWLVKNAETLNPK